MLLKKKKKYKVVRDFKENKRKTTMNYGDYGLQACENKMIPASKLTLAEIEMKRAVLNSNAKLYIRVFPCHNIAGEWYAEVKKDNILYEVSNINEEEARSVFGYLAYSLEISHNFLIRDNLVNEDDLNKLDDKPKIKTRHKL